MIHGHGVPYLQVGDKDSYTRAYQDPGKIFEVFKDNLLRSQYLGLPLVGAIDIPYGFFEDFRHIDDSGILSFEN
jgi:hypothetical protein